MKNIGLYVQYGCGWDAPEGWVNFDASPTLRIERLPFCGKFISATLKGNPEPFPMNVRYGDIVSGLPVKEGACAGVYCSHVLEHLSLQDCRRALHNTFRMLSPEGIFRLVVPDLSFYIERYSINRHRASALAFLQDTGLGEISRKRGLIGIVGELFGNSRHRWMWDFLSLQSLLVDVGFDKIRRANFGDSADPEFTKVERRERWNNALGIECRKQ